MNYPQIRVQEIASGSDAGARLTEEALTVLRGIGIGEIGVRRRPRLALACTGRELVDPDGAELAPGQIANTNGPYLAPLFADAGAEVVECLTLPDDPQVLAMHLERWYASGVDLIVTTGAVSMGRYDFVPDALASTGATIRFHKVRMRPGKPLLFATAPGGALIFGLPGNPISSTVGARFFVDAALRAMSGRSAESPLMLPLADDVRKKAGFSMIQKAACSLAADGRLSVRALKGQESFKTAPLLLADAWLVLPEDAEMVPAGSLIPVFPLRPAGSGFLQGPMT